MVKKRGTNRKNQSKKPAAGAARILIFYNPRPSYPFRDPPKKCDKGGVAIFKDKVTSIKNHCFFFIFWQLSIFLWGNHHEISSILPLFLKNEQKSMIFHHDYSLKIIEKWWNTNDFHKGYPMKIVEKIIKNYCYGFYENYLYQMEVVTKTQNMNQNFVALNLYFRGTNT